jgi:simple sugar transport system permease protein
MRTSGESTKAKCTEILVLPAANLLAALVVSGVVVRIVGENPFTALRLMLGGAFGSAEGMGYTLYYATNFIFTGLAVAVAYQSGLFNIGAEGQAYVGGLGAGLVCLAAGTAPFWVVLPAAICAAAVFGAAWAFIPAWLQARRGCHIVITTIMFNFIASSLMTWLLVNVLIKPGQQSPETREFGAGAWQPTASELLSRIGIHVAASPLNFSFLIALAAAAGVWVLVWRTRWGYAIRVIGENPAAGFYAGISPSKVAFLVMLLSGALAGGLSLNELMGAQHRISLDFPAGAGFVGIAVALMGRNHPVGVCVSAVLFGALVQGGSELSFDMPHINRDMVVVIQGLVILFCGALDNLFEKPLRILRGRH